MAGSFRYTDEQEAKSDDSRKLPAKAITRKQESTRFLAYELLDMDVGYSSDEGAADDAAYYVSLLCCYVVDIDVFEIDTLTFIS